MRFLKKLLHNKIFKRLTFKIPFAYFIVIIATVTISCMVLYKISGQAAQKEINEASVKTVTSVKSNVDFMLQNVDNYSKMMLSDSNLQYLLRKGDVYSNLQTQSKVSAYFYNLIQTEPVIDSVYVFDHSGNCFSVGQSTSFTFEKNSVKDAPWYGQVVKNNGKYILSHNGGGVFSNSTKSNFVSFIRLIRDLDSVDPLGIMVINIPEDSFIQAYSNIVKKNDLQVIILDENNKIIASGNAENDGVHIFQMAFSANNTDLKQRLALNSSGNTVYDCDSGKYLISYVSEGKSGWKYVSIAQYYLMQTGNHSFMIFAVFLLLIDGAIFFISSFLISRSIINPMRQILNTMKNADNGAFSEITAVPGSLEFERLFTGYNKMIHQIKHLFEKIIEEQKIIRKSELNTLQAQIKPHFLYNTLDSIASLALSGCNEDVCFLVESLGNYYRNSVSKGREIITVGEEIDIVRNYLNIQKVRYQDLFEVEYQIDQSCLDYQMPKLVLQPLVENSIYHGIRPKGTSGLISISACETEDAVVLTVADDGVGMSQEEIASILKKEKDGKIKSFGLHGTMERIRIYYGEKDRIKIESEPGKGTQITITIPKEADMRGAY